MTNENILVHIQNKNLRILIATSSISCDKKNFEDEGTGDKQLKFFCYNAARYSRVEVTASGLLTRIPALLKKDINEDGDNYGITQLSIANFFVVVQTKCI